MHVQLNGFKLIFHSNCYADNIICKKKKKKKNTYIYIYIYIYMYYYYYYYYYYYSRITENNCFLVLVPDIKYWIEGEHVDQIYLDH